MHHYTSERVLRDTPRETLQYAASGGDEPLREWVADQMAQQGLRVDASQVLITTGSQQGLDLIGNVLLDAGSRVAAESPTHLGASFATVSPDRIAHGIAALAAALGEMT